MDENEPTRWPCQNLLGGGGAAIYGNIDGMCQHLECHPKNKDRIERGDRMKTFTAVQHISYGWDCPYCGGFCINNFKNPDLEEFAICDHCGKKSKCEGISR